MPSFCVSVLRTKMGHFEHILLAHKLEMTYDIDIVAHCNSSYVEANLTEYRVGTLRRQLRHSD